MDLLIITTASLVRRTERVFALCFISFTSVMVLTANRDGRLFVWHFFDFRRGSLALRESLNGFVFHCDESEACSGFAMNEIGTSHLLLKCAGLSENCVEDCADQITK